MALGIAMGVRDFDCALCGRHFSRMTCDLIAPSDMVCDECLEELGHPNQKELWEIMSRRKAEEESVSDQGAEGRESP